MKRTKKHFFLFDWVLLFVVVLLVLFGILMVFESSTVSAASNFGDKYYFLKEQSKWALIAMAAMVVFSFFDYHRFYYLALPFLLLTIFLLLLVFVPGIGVKALGAHRWLNFRLFIMQPSELTKLAVVIYLSAWLSYKEGKRLFAFLLLLGVLVGLIVLQPDLGTAFIVIAIGLSLYFVSGASLWHFLILLPITMTAVLGLAVAAPYRLARLTSFFNPFSDPLGISYHIRQVLISLGSGGFLGVGLGRSRQKFAFLPESSTDSIFAIIAEELGFMGAIFLIMIFILLIWRGIQIAQKAPDNFGKLLAFGIISWLGIQILINLSSMTALFPLTGVPLPFVSYGGSSLVVNLIAMGILFNIDRQSLK